MGFLKYLARKIRFALILFGMVLVYPGMCISLLSNPAPNFDKFEAWIPLMIGGSMLLISLLTTAYVSYKEKQTGNGNKNWWEIFE